MVKYYNSTPQDDRGDGGGRGSTYKIAVLQRCLLHVWKASSGHADKDLPKQKMPDLQCEDSTLPYFQSMHREPNLQCDSASELKNFEPQDEYYGQRAMLQLCLPVILLGGKCVIKLLHLTWQWPGDFQMSSSLMFHVNEHACSVEAQDFSISRQFFFLCSGVNSLGKSVYATSLLYQNFQTCPRSLCFRDYCLKDRYVLTQALCNKEKTCFQLKKAHLGSFLSPCQENVTDSKPLQLSEFSKGLTIRE